MLRIARMTLTVFIVAGIIWQGSLVGYSLYLGHHLPALPEKTVIPHDTMTVDTPAQIALYRQVGQLKKQADTAFESGNYRLALAIREQLLDLDAHDVVGWEDQAWLAWSVCKDTEQTLSTRAFYTWYAYDAMYRGVEANRDNPLAWASMGSFYQRVGLPWLGVPCYAQAVKLGGGPVEADKAADIRKDYGLAVQRAGMPLASIYWFQHLSIAKPGIFGVSSRANTAIKYYKRQLLRLAGWLVMLGLTLALRQATKRAVKGRPTEAAGELCAKEARSLPEQDIVALIQANPGC